METTAIIQELKFRTSRSSGAGGQNVNKVETKVELLFDLYGSTSLTDIEKDWIATRLSNRLTKDGILIVSSQRYRSQLANKEDAIATFVRLLENALQPPKKRKKIKPLTADRETRLKSKKIQSEKKASRQKISL